MRFSFLILPVLALGLAAAPLAAQDARFGVQGALAFPTGDLGDNAGVGVQLGGHVRWNFGQGQGLMARADFTSYGSRYGVDTSSFALAADYTYHPHRDQLGIYLLAGLSFQDCHRSFPDGAVNDNGLGLDLGVGYDLNRNLGLQARITSQSADNGNLTALNLGVTYTF